MGGDESLYFISSHGDIHLASAGIMVRLDDEEVDLLMRNYSNAERLEMAKCILTAPIDTRVAREL